VRVLTPRYRALAEAFPRAKTIARPHWLGGELPTCAIRSAKTEDGLRLWMVDYPPYFERSGANPYLHPDGHDWPDNPLRYALLSRVAAWLATPASTLAWRPHVLHCNDWQSALSPAYLALLPSPAGGETPCVLSIHNLAFQGSYHRLWLTRLGLPLSAWRFDAVECYGMLSFLKAGIQFGRAITTVSPTYAQEILADDEGKGMGFSGLLRHRSADVRGIINGIDETTWDPGTDPYLSAPFTTYDARSLAKKAKNKRALQIELGLKPTAERPLFGVVSRLTGQKGLDLLATISDQLLELPAQLVVLGSGETTLEAAFKRLAAAHPEHCAVRIGFDEKLAHRIEAGVDCFVMPSRFEPCGLNQMYSQRYGTPPIVRKTGGLADTVVDAANRQEGSGFVFEQTDSAGLLATVKRAAALYQNPRRWKKLQLNGMRRDFSWRAPAASYIQIYKELAARR